MGYGLVELRHNRSVHVASGVIRADGDSPLHERLSTIYTALQVVIDVHKPQAVAVEGVFSHKNARSALILGHARGVALLLAAQAGLGVHEYAPARVKKSVGAGGNDSKDAVQRMVERLLELKEPLERSDAYDALAVALCHVHQLRVPQGMGSKKSPALRFTAAQRRSSAESFLARLKPAVVRVAP